MKKKKNLFGKMLEELKEKQIKEEKQIRNEEKQIKEERQIRKEEGPKKEELKEEDKIEI
jgi:hypothetical protein